MKTKNKMIAFVEIAIVLCSLFLVALPAIAAEQTTQKVSASAVTTASEDDYVLGVYGNANEDDTIDMGDVVYTKLAIFGKKPKTELCDAKYDGRINVLDVIQTKLIILGKEKELTIVDGADRILTVKKPIERMVLLHPNSALIVKILGSTDKVVGVDKKKILGWVTSMPLPEFSDCTDVGSFNSPDYETILELQPDTVLLYATFGSNREEVQNKLESIDPDIQVIRLDCYRPTSYAEDVRKIGFILGKKEEADEFIDFYSGVRNTIKERVEVIPKDERPKVYLESSSPYSTCAEGSGYHEKIVISGGNNIFADESTPYPKVDPEAVIERDPEIIIKLVRARHAGGYDTDDLTELSSIRDEIMGRPELANIAAVTNKRVYVICSDIFGGTDHFIAFP